MTTFCGFEKGFLYERVDISKKNMRNPPSAGSTVRVYLISKNKIIQSFHVVFQYDFWVINEHQFKMGLTLILKK